MDDFQNLIISLVECASQLKNETVKENIKSNLIKCTTEVLVKRFGQSISVNGDVFLLEQQKNPTLPQTKRSVGLVSSVACFMSRDKVDADGKYQQLLDVLTSFCSKRTIELAFQEPPPKRLKVDFGSLCLDKNNYVGQISENLIVVQKANELECISNSFFAFSTILGYIQVLKKVAEGRLPEFLRCFFFAVQPKKDFEWPVIPYAFIDDPGKNKKILLFCFCFGPGIFDLFGRISTFNSSSQQRKSYDRILRSITTLSYAQIKSIYENIFNYQSNTASKIFEKLMAPIGKKKPSIWNEFHFILQEYCSQTNYDSKKITDECDFDTNKFTDCF